MKQIFDWLREQMYSNSYDCCESNYSVDMVVDEDVAIRMVDEAEAKWEADCCEWEHREHYANCFCKCNGIMVEHDIAIGFNFCPYCGKRIKISEVE